MASIKIPFIAWRNGRPRFVPGPRERGLGYAGEDLRHLDQPGRPWFGLAEAKVWADIRHAEILEARGRGRKPKAPPSPRGRTVADLLESWLAAIAGTVEPTTLSGYRRQVHAIITKPRSSEFEEMSRSPVGAVEKPEALAFITYQMRVRGPYMGRASRAVLNAAYQWGSTSTTWRLKQNPFAKLRLPKPKGRVVIFLDSEIRALIAAAEALDRPSIGDAILLGVFTGQRQGDRLALEDIGLFDGRRNFRQRKTGAIVAIPETPALKARLEAARARVGLLCLERGLGQGHAARPVTIVVDETTAAAWNEHTYRHEFARARALAIAGSAELTPCPSLAGKRDQDLRDTAVTWLARAGCTLPEIAGVTGHTLKSIHTILAHYLAITPELADSAIAKLIVWMDREGMAV